MDTLNHESVRKVKMANVELLRVSNAMSLMKNPAADLCRAHSTFKNPALPLFAAEALSQGLIGCMD
jgi:hypothetical protein